MSQTTSTASSASGTAIRTARWRRAAIVAGGCAIVGLGARPAVADAPPGPPAAADRNTPGKLAEDSAARTAGSAPASPAAKKPTVRQVPLLAPLRGQVSAPRQYALERAKDGSRDLIYDAGPFEARVNPTGDVTFHDKKVTDFNPLPFLPFGPNYGVPNLQQTVRGLFGVRAITERPPDRPGLTAPPETRMVIPEVTPHRPDPREACHYPKTCGIEANFMVVSATGRFDLTDELLRSHGQDPYRVEKARFLAATRELRTELAAHAHADAVRRALGELPQRLHMIATDPQFTPRERRGIIQALRAELDTSTPEGVSARAEIDRFLAAPPAGLRDEPAAPSQHSQ